MKNSFSGQVYQGLLKDNRNSHIKVQKILESSFVPFCGRCSLMGVIV